MPTLNSTHTINISPEKFINACSSEEIQELSLLLNSARFDSIFQNTTVKSDSNLNISANQLLESVNAGKNHREVYAECVRLFGEHPIEAIKILGEIHQKARIGFNDILPLMQDYKMLEALRVKYLVKKPQEISEESN